VWIQRFDASARETRVSEDSDPESSTPHMTSSWAGRKSRARVGELLRDMRWRRSMLMPLPSRPLPYEELLWWRIGATS
jgi:hypothetical protein